MKRLVASILALGAFAALSALPAFAAPQPASAARCCRVPPGTLVEVQLVDEVSTKVQKAGDTFALRLARPLIVNGRVVLRAGTPGVGQIVESAKPGMGGKAAKLVLAAEYLTQRGAHVPLHGLQLAAVGRGNVAASEVMGIGAIAFAPLNIVAFAIKGGDVVLPPGTIAIAKVSSGVVLPSLGRASHEQMAAAEHSSSASAALDSAKGSIDIPPPPPGKGQVVFFRDKSLMGTGQWFNVREDGKVLGKLANGAYFVQTAEPGPHTYTAKAEPEFNDKLKLQIDPDETYFVEGIMTKAVVIGAADLTPSNRAAFNKASAKLKPAAPDAAVATNADPAH
jgi:hypothetical protein